MIRNLQLNWYCQSASSKAQLRYIEVPSTQYNSIIKSNQFKSTQGDMYYLQNVLHAKLRHSVLGEVVPSILFTLHSSSRIERERIREEKRQSIKRKDRRWRRKYSNSFRMLPCVVNTSLHVLFYVVQSLLAKCGTYVTDINCRK